MSIEFFDNSDHYYVIFPDLVTLYALRRWGALLQERLIMHEECRLLIDTGKHQFESLECLSWLRNFLARLSEKNALKVAFVQNAHIQPLGIVSDREGHFVDTPSARQWLVSQSLDRRRADSLSDDYSLNFHAD